MREKILNFLKENKIDAITCFQAIESEVPLWRLQTAIETGTNVRLFKSKTVEDVLKIGYNNYHFYFNDSSDYLVGYEKESFTEVFLKQKIETPEASNNFVDSDGYECLNVYLDCSRDEFFEKQFKELDWNLEHSKYGYCLETWSPAGENLVFEAATFGELLEDLSKAYDNFDVDEHVEMWMPERGKKGVPDSIERLIEDAKEIDKMYEQLQELVQKYLGLMV